MGAICGMRTRRADSLLIFTAASLLQDLGLTPRGSPFRPALSRGHRAEVSLCGHDGRLILRPLTPGIEEPQHGSVDLRPLCLAGDSPRTSDAVGPGPVAALPGQVRRGCPVGLARLSWRQLPLACPVNP